MKIVKFNIQTADQKKHVGHLELKCTDSEATVLKKVLKKNGCDKVSIRKAK